MNGNDDQNADPAETEISNNDGATVDDAEELLREIDAEQEEVGDELYTVEQEKQDAKDRFKIAQIVLWLFAITSGATVAFVVVILLFTNTDVKAWQPAADFLLKLLTSLVLPVVTLVIGYYFGKQRSGG